MSKLKISDKREMIAATIIQGGGDYVLQVKDNQKTLREDISYYLEQEVASQPKKVLQSIGQWAQTKEKSHGRIEDRTCYITNFLLINLCFVSNCPAVLCALLDC